MAVLREEMQWTLVRSPKYASLVARMSHVDNNILTGFHTLSGFNEHDFG